MHLGSSMRNSLATTRWRLDQRQRPPGRPATASTSRQQLLRATVPRGLDCPRIITATVVLSSDASAKPCHQHHCRAAAELRQQRDTTQLASAWQRHPSAEAARQAASSTQCALRQQLGLHFSSADNRSGARAAARKGLAA
eukprot:8767869-Alexandrium_andersonii.AAC.2